MEEAANATQKKKRALMIFGVILIVSAIGLFFYLQYKATHISTDDAYVDGRIHSIASKIPGTVMALHVKDNQAVKKGDLLLDIDPADYAVREVEAGSAVTAEKAKLAEADARIAAARSQFAEMTARHEAAKASLDLQIANLRQADIDLKRAKNLLQKEAISRDRFERVSTAFDVGTSQVRAAEEQLKQAEKALETQKAFVRSAEVTRDAQRAEIQRMEAKLDAAELNVSYTKIYAPVDGYITKRSVEVGNQIQTGQPLMAVVSLNDLWVTANYKETQLEKVKPGQRVEITVDTYSGKTFKGKVDSIMSGTGAVFSLFPPENATGNYVKVVQRIPVKILLDKEGSPKEPLRIGMSVVPTIIIE